MNKRNSGFSPIIILVIIVVLIIAFSAGSYYILNSQGKYGTTNDYYAPVPQYSYTPSPTPVSDATVDIESDVDNLNIESPDSDLQKIEKDASSL